MLTAFQTSQAQNQTQNPNHKIFKQLPKVELHVHAEGGTLDQETLKWLAQRNQAEVPTQLFSKDNTNLKYNAPDFGHFLAVYDQATSYIQSPEEVQEVIYRYLKRCHLEGATYVELTCSPDHVQKFRKTYQDVQAELSGKGSVKNSEPAKESISYASFVEAVVAGINQANKEFGIEARILMVLLRHNGADAAMRTLNDMLAYPHPYVVGINLAGDEEKFPPELFEECYAKAKKHGLKLTAHVGEHAGPEKIVDAVNKMGLDRVGHGVTAIRSPQVMQFLRDRKIPLELCPSSNVSLGLFSSLAEHPLKQFLDYGILFSINSDDPTFFASSLGQEYAKVQAHWQLTDEQMLNISANSIQASFAEATLKAFLLAQMALYEHYHKLKKMLEPFKQNHLYQQLLRYEDNPSVDLVVALNCAIQDDFVADSEVPLQSQSLVLAHRAFESARKHHQSELVREMTTFTDKVGVNKLAASVQRTVIGF